MRMYIYRTDKGNYYLESENTYKHTKNKFELFEIDTDYPNPIKKTQIQQEIKSSEDVDKLLFEIFGE